MVIPDETDGELADDWSRFGDEVEFGHLVLPVTNSPYHYRLIASIVLAEISRQVGRRSRALPPVRPTRPFYDRALELVAEEEGEAVPLQQLVSY